MSERTEWRDVEEWDIKQCTMCNADKYSIEEKVTDLNIPMIKMICRQCLHEEVVYCG